MDETKPADAVPAAPAGDAAQVEAVKDEEGLDSREPSQKDIAAGSNEQAPSGASLQSLTDKTLHFLSHASNETLGACLVGLGATTYFVLGRIGLVIIGVAGGVVLHATWEGTRGDGGDKAAKAAEHQKRREAGVEVAKRVLDWKSSRKRENDQPEDAKLLAHRELDFSRFGPETETALNTFTDAIIKDYVHYWYDPTIPGEQSFPTSCRQTLVAFLLSLTGHLGRKRPADAFLDFVTNASSIIIVFLNELEAAINASPNAAAEDAIAAYLALKPDSSLSYMLNQDSQKAKLEDAAEDILQAYLDPKAYNCQPVHVFLTQVLAELVLGYTVTYCSAPTFLNEWIVYGLEESETTKEVMEMVDAGVEGRQNENGISDNGVPVQAAEKLAEAQNHRRQTSRAGEAMDEAMQEAKRLTQLMVEEDEKRARDEQQSQTAASSSEDVSVSTAQGMATPTSSQSDGMQQSVESGAWSTQPSSPRASETAQEERPVTPSAKPQSTSFDQMLPSQHPTALSPDRTRLEPPQLTLHNATINIFDDSQPGERASIKAKPDIDYMIQIEPSSGGFSGWMIFRKYADFETLHEVLRRISVITGVAQFNQAHPELPKWKTNTKTGLRQELERYLMDAVRYQQLAESEGMKRFLEKEQGLSKSPSGNKGFGWPNPDAFGKFGGDMMNVLTKAPKQGLAGGIAGGKAVFGGVSGLVGGVVGGKKQGTPSQTSLSRTTSNSTVDGMVSYKPRISTVSDGHAKSTSGARQSQDSLRSVQQYNGERKSSLPTTASGEIRTRTDGLSSGRPSSDFSRSIDPNINTHRPLPTSAQESSQTSPTRSDMPTIPSLDGGLEAAFNLPPPPSEISDDFAIPSSPSRKSTDTFRSTNLDLVVSSGTAPATPPRPTKPTPKPKAESKAKEPLTERETSVAIELMFAVIQELYTLSSAWNIRRTLLTAAKNFLLRPGNPQLLAIKDMLQTSMLDSNLSDAGIAAHVYKLRENALPTAEEMEIWKRDYPEKTEEQKEELRLKAKTLLVTKGMPQALTSVMGAAASGQALGRVFDCLQMERVSRGLVFGLVLQALRIVTH
ncbi:hypothetical protein EJ03DRAFT_312240 [Teratosphaeria nubilosa]|uniref:PXA domain-containing protein n=1 Tax=Teratosphaeria nubilosa TaxID=161662 RepID=A0A6G1L9B1_9PEZI|nr:hypothetical protein EJ03DRAFT_312240 [Teratosphaeria nubilosa]